MSSRLQYNKFVLFGDSITEFSNNQERGYSFQADLQHWYSRKFDIINRGFAGYNTDHAVKILPEIFKQEQGIKMMTIFFGTNDAVTGVQHVPLDKYEANLNEMVKLCKLKGVRPILIGPGLHDHKLDQLSLESRGIFTDLEKTTNAQNKKYSDVAEAVARQHNLPFINLWEIVRVDGGWSKEELLSDKYVNVGEYYFDGVHFLTKTYKLWHKHLVEVIKKEYPEYDPDNLPLNLTYWRLIDPENLEETMFKGSTIPEEYK